jgi:hypothetical protein
MKKKDLYLILGITIVVIPFVLFADLLEFYKKFNQHHFMITSFLKFALLATLGESIGLRIKKGVYNHAGFGLIPRAVVWGFLGMVIKMIFIVFAFGIPVFIEKMGFKGAMTAMGGGFSSLKLLDAFSISVTMNLIFAPVFMTLHQVTDRHIIDNNGSIKSLIKPIKFGHIFANLNWNVQYNFVFKKTIPLFWIPAHTVTFLLPPNYQILFAAGLGIILGIILAIASIKAN